MAQPLAPADRCAQLRLCTLRGSGELLSLNLQYDQIDYVLWVWHENHFDAKILGYTPEEMLDIACYVNRWLYEQKGYTLFYDKDSYRACDVDSLHLACLEVMTIDDHFAATPELRRTQVFGHGDASFTLTTVADSTPLFVIEREDGSHPPWVTDHEKIPELGELGHLCHTCQERVKCALKRRRPLVWQSISAVESKMLGSDGEPYRLIDIIRRKCLWSA